MAMLSGSLHRTGAEEEKALGLSDRLQIGTVFNPGNPNPMNTGCLMSICIYSQNHSGYVLILASTISRSQATRFVIVDGDYR